MPHDCIMCHDGQTPIDAMEAALGGMSAWLATQSNGKCGELVIRYRRIIDRTEGFAAEATRRFEKSGGYAADGALGMVPWLKEKAKLGGGEAAQHVQVARQLEQLVRTEEALARGEIGYQHAVIMARTAEHVGAAVVRKAEVSLLEAAETIDADQFVAVAKNFEHQVDADSVLSEATRAHQRRYFSIAQPVNGLTRVEGQLVAEAAATLRSAMEPYLKPAKGDERTTGQRMHDALIAALQRSGGRRARGSGQPGQADSAPPRPQLIIKTSADTLAGIPGASAGELQWGGTVPADTVRRLACDAAIIRITGLSELELEISRAARTLPPSMRRALVVRDGHCIFPGCDRPAPWCEGHHLKFWADGGETKLENLGLVCVAHHRKVHEEGWTLRRSDGRWVAEPPRMKIAPRARSS